MLTIRNNQIDAFRIDIDAALMERLRKFLESELPHAIAGLPDDCLSRRLKRGVSRGREYGFETDLSLVTFVALMFEFGPDFDRHPSVARILHGGQGIPDERMLTLALESSDRLWDELAILADLDWGDGFVMTEEGS